MAMMEATVARNPDAPRPSLATYLPPCIIYNELAFTSYKCKVALTPESKLSTVAAAKVSSTTSHLHGAIARPDATTGLN